MANPFNVKKDNVVVQLDDAKTQTESGIYTGGSKAAEKIKTGIVVAVGPGARDDSGALMPMDVKVGERVMLTKYGPTEFKHDGIEYAVAPEFDVLLGYPDGD